MRADAEGRSSKWGVSDVPTRMCSATRLAEHKENLLHAKFLLEILATQC